MRNARKWALAPIPLASDITPVHLPTSPHPRAARRARGSPAGYSKSEQALHSGIFGTYFQFNKSRARA